MGQRQRQRTKTDIKAKLPLMKYARMHAGAHTHTHANAKYAHRHRVIFSPMRLIHSLPIQHLCFVCQHPRTRRNETPPSARSQCHRACRAAPLPCHRDARTIHQPNHYINHIQCPSSTPKCDMNALRVISEQLLVDSVCWTDLPDGVVLAFVSIV